MNERNNNENVLKQEYESVSCNVIEIKLQGVLCASNEDVDGGGLYGGLGPYSGSAL